MAERSNHPSPASRCRDSASTGSAPLPNARSKAVRAARPRRRRVSGWSTIQRSARASRSRASAIAAARDTTSGPRASVRRSARREAGERSSESRRAASSARHGESSSRARRSAAAKGFLSSAPESLALSARPSPRERVSSAAQKADGSADRTARLSARAVLFESRNRASSRSRVATRRRECRRERRAPCRATPKPVAIAASRTAAARKRVGEGAGMSASFFGIPGAALDRARQIGRARARPAQDLGVYARGEAALADRQAKELAGVRRGDPVGLGFGPAPEPAQARDDAPEQRRLVAAERARLGLEVGRVGLEHQHVAGGLSHGLVQRRVPVGEAAAQAELESDAPGARDGLGAVVEAVQDPTGRRPQLLEDGE